MRCGGPARAYRARRLGAARSTVSSTGVNARGAACRQGRKMRGNSNVLWAPCKTPAKRGRRERGRAHGGGAGVRGRTVPAAAAAAPRQKNDFTKWEGARRPAVTRPAPCVESASGACAGALPRRWVWACGAVRVRCARQLAEAQSASALARRKAQRGRPSRARGRHCGGGARLCRAVGGGPQANWGHRVGRVRCRCRERRARARHVAKHVRTGGSEGARSATTANQI